MTIDEAEELYNSIRSYYNFYVPKSVFCNTYLREFKECPYRLIRQAVQAYCEKGYNSQPPTLMDVKSYLLRRKWVIQSNYRQGRENKTLTLHKVEMLKGAVETISKALNGYGSELEDDYKRLEDMRQMHMKPHQPSYVSLWNTEQLCDYFVNVGELFDV